jgi:hypothetical protein
MTRASLVRLALFALAGLALFSLLFSLAADNGLWPRLPPGALHDTDLWAGLAAGVALLLLFLRGAKSQRGRGGEGVSAGEAEPESHAASASGISPSPPLPLTPSGTSAAKELTSRHFLKREQR